MSRIDVDAEGTNRQRQASERLQRVPSSQRFSEQIESRTLAKPSGDSKSSRSASVCYLPCSQVGPSTQAWQSVSYSLLIVKTRWMVHQLEINDFSAHSHGPNNVASLGPHCWYTILRASLKANQGKMPAQWLCHIIAVTSHWLHFGPPTVHLEGRGPGPWGVLLTCDLSCFLSSYPVNLQSLSKDENVVNSCIKEAAVSFYSKKVSLHHPCFMYMYPNKFLDGRGFNNFSFQSLHSSNSSWWWRE